MESHQLSVCGRATLPFPGQCREWTRSARHVWRSGESRKVTTPLLHIPALRPRCARRGPPNTMVKPVGQTSHPSAPLWRGQNLLGFRAEFKFFVYHTMCIPYIPTTKNENDIRGSSTDHVSLARSKLCLIKRRVGSSDLCIIRLQSTANASSQHSRTSPAPACMKPHQSMPFVSNCNTWTYRGPYCRESVKSLLSFSLFKLEPCAFYACSNHKLRIHLL